MARRGERITRDVDDVEAARLKSKIGGWIWHEGEPWVIARLEWLAIGHHRLLLEKAVSDSNSMMWKFRNRPLVFGPDRTVLETWMDEDFYNEKLGVSETD